MQMLADAIFFFSLNFIGFYVRYVGEINLRRGFLDKRDCIETTFKLKYEREQEEQLLLSIIPKHIATQVKESISAFLQKFKVNEKRSPFKYDVSVFFLLRQNCLHITKEVVYSLIL